MSQFGDWLFSVALKKAIRSLVGVLIAMAGADRLAHFGVTVDPVVMTGALAGLLELGRNYLKVRFGFKIL